ncbi:MAG: diaminopimelate decarboxylase [Acidobacteriota bacterium]
MAETSDDQAVGCCEPSYGEVALKACAALSSALAAGLLSEDDTAAVVYDLDGLDARLQRIQDNFPAGALHAVAVKAAPLAALLERVVSRGAGLEAASLPELHMALTAGCPPERIVFDSPAKTRSELRQAVELGVHLNADNFQELERLDEIVPSEPKGRGSLGLRVNPQVGLGSIAATSVAGEYSKFGEPVSGREEIIEAFARRPWLTGLHMHVGSQGCGLDLFTRAARILLDLRRDIHAACGREQITRLDLGGGLPVRYAPEQGAPSMGDYSDALRRECPELFDGGLRVFTEFGRWVFANQAFAASRVEYVKQQPGYRTAVVHLGADMFLRPCYAPQSWRHEIVAAGPDGALKQGPVGVWNVAGPLCFSGDFLAKSRPLPDLSPGDHLILLDAGAYTMGMWSRYNSRQMPVVLGFEGGTPRVLKKRETLEQVLDFWK